MKFVTQDYYEILNVGPGAGNEDVKRAYRTVRGSFRPDSMAIHSLYSAEETEAISAKIDEAFRILSNPESTRRYSTYHRSARVGMTVPRDPDQFFDQVHALDEPSPIEDLAKHLGRNKRAREEGRQVQTLPPKAKMSIRLAAEPTPVTGPVSPPVVRPPPAPLAAIAAEPLAAVASVEILLDSLEEVPEQVESAPQAWPAVAGPERPAPPSWSPAAAGPVTGPVAGGSLGMLGAGGSGKLSSVRGRGIQANAQHDPSAQILPGAQVAEQPPTLTSVRPVQTSAAPKIDYASRRWHRETVRTRAVGPLDVRPLEADVVEALEMDCGGINGAFLQQVRRELDINLQDIADRTKIGLSMLRYIEDDRLDQLPARVYLKGYLSQMCRLLKLPVPEIPDRYLARS